MRPRYLVRAGVVATALIGVGLVGLWAAEEASQEPAPTASSAVSSSVVVGVSFAAQQARPLLDRNDVRRRIQNARKTGREFVFTRAIYNGGGYRWGAWATDFPKADRQFLTILDRLVDMDAYELENAVQLDDPNIRKFPFL